MLNDALNALILVALEANDIRSRVSQLHHDISKRPYETRSRALNGPVTKAEGLNPTTRRSARSSCARMHTRANANKCLHSEFGGGNSGLKESESPQTTLGRTQGVPCPIGHRSSW